MLTTITPYWGRPDQLRIWVEAIKGATFPGLQHLIYCVGEPVLDFDKLPAVLGNMRYLLCPEKPGLSIAHYHNRGALLAESPWIMKLDVDTLPHVDYFKALLPLLESAKPREWFNGGMIYVTKTSTKANLWKGPLELETYQRIMGDLVVHSTKGRSFPQATNFICRREDYLALGGCDERFRGYGWEDYYQIYMLERHFQGKDPLPGQLDFHNVTQRCRDEISRPKAAELFKRDPRLCLLHCWHPSSPMPSYKDTRNMNRNKELVLEYILKHR